MVFLLDNPIRSYPWGSTTVLPELLGRTPDGAPQAELWIGAHPGSPSVIGSDGREHRTLEAYIDDDPEAALGPSIVERFGPRLPFLLKILAIERPLSIQAHPTIDQAAAGFAAEDAAGVAIDAPERLYRDRHHKPEMVVALTDFEALLGFDEPEAIAGRLVGFGIPALDAAAAALREVGLEAVVTGWLSMPEGEVAALVSAISAVARDRIGEPYALVERLSAIYPDDRGVLLALALRHTQLAPGEAAFVGAGVPHAYLSGVAVEPQASSDNTLRAGLTPKHVDAAEIARVLRFEPGGATLITPVVRGSTRSYRAPGVEDFLLTRVDVSAIEEPIGPAPVIVLVVDGAATVHSGGAATTLRRGHAAFVPASDATPVTLSGRGVAYALTAAIDPAQ